MPFPNCMTYQCGAGRRQLVLNKGAERYIFRYDAGREDELLDSLIDAAKDPRTNFDWFDAAVLSFKLTQSLMAQADYLLGEDDGSNKGSISDWIDPTNQTFDPRNHYKGS